jgi:predicted RNA-binding protein with PIN domain
MSVPVVIDGNNLLHAARDVEDPDRLLGRSMLCDQIGRWAQRQGERVLVVFDGPAPSAALAEQIGHPDIQVTYSGAGVSADAVVTDILENHSAARTFVVVSTDRAIQRVAKRRRAKAVRSDVFWAGLKEDLARPPARPSEPEEKEAGLSPEATAAWLAEFGLDGSAELRPDGLGDVDEPPRRPVV